MMEFFKDEFNLNPEDLERFAGPQIKDLYDKCCHIEVREVMDGHEDSDRCHIATSLVDYLYANF